MPDITDLTYFDVVRTVAPVPDGVLSADVTFEAQITRGLAVQADVSAEVLEVLLRPVHARIVDGILMKDGAASVSLLSAAEVAVDGFSYVASFKNARTDGRALAARDALKDLSFDALDGAGTFDLKDAAPIVSSTAVPTARGPRGYGMTGLFRGKPADQTAMLAAPATAIGDWVIRGDTSTVWVVTALPASTVGNWVELDYPVSASSWSSLIGKPAVIAAGADAASARAAINAVDDFDFRMDDTRTPTDGSVTAASFHSSLAGLTGMSSPNFLVTLTAVLNADNSTNATTKITRYGVSHYTNSEEPFFGLVQTSDATNNSLYFGGGSSLGNAATTIRFYTAAANTTVTGTLRAFFDGAGIFSQYNDVLIGENTGTTRTVSLNAAAGNNRTIQFRTAGVSRWSIHADNTAESGSDSGTNFLIQSRTDAGAAKTTVVSIARDTGIITLGGALITTASATSGAGIRLPHGTAPTSPVDGALWTTTAGLFTRINGATIRATDTTPSRLLAPVAYTSGQYFFCNSQGNTSTSAVTNNTVRVSAWLVTETITISRLFGEFTTAGEAGSVFRFGIWNDDGTGKPGTVLLDGGGASTAGTPGPIEVTVSQVLTPGIYWVGGVAQNGPTTAPIMRVIVSATLQGAMPLGTTLPTLGSGGVYLQSSVSGALGTFTATPTVTSNAPRIGFKVA